MHLKTNNIYIHNAHESTRLSVGHECLDCSSVKFTSDLIVTSIIYNLLNRVIPGKRNVCYIKFDNSCVLVHIQNTTSDAMALKLDNFTPRNSVNFIMCISMCTTTKFKPVFRPNASLLKKNESV